VNTSYGLDAYRAHDLNIAMKTSSGDVIKMDFANEQTASLRHQENDNGSKTSMSFSSMQSFQFSIKSNGISEQDQKEIDGFMKIARPFIDSFLKELGEDAPKSPVTQLANKIASIFDPNKQRDEDSTNATKNGIVNMFDNALGQFEAPKTTNLEETMKKIFEDTQKLLEKTLKEFDEFNKNIYA